MDVKVIVEWKGWRRKQFWSVSGYEQFPFILLFLLRGMILTLSLSASYIQYHKIYLHHIGFGNYCGSVVP